MSLHHLNDEQRAAATAAETEVLVLAGAGSGKTRTLVERVAYLIEQCGVSGYEVVCTTFTRAAAEEMRLRLEARIGKEASKVTVSTFHGIGLRLIRKYGHLIGFAYQMTSVYGAVEQEILLQACGEQTGDYVKGKWKHGKKTLDAFFACIERGDEPDKASPYHGLYNIFLARCRENNALPYYGLLDGIVSLAESNQLSGLVSWKYLIVDEVQDLDKKQWRVIEALLNMRSHEKGHLFAVGDIAQSIYSFRGAVPWHIETLAASGRFTIYTLQTNYRSQQPIVEAANMLISHNSHSSVQMRSARQNSETGESIARLENADSVSIAAFIQGYISQDVKDIAILCRNNGMLDKISTVLSERTIEHTRIGKKTSALKTPLFVQYHAVIKCLANKYDNLSFLLAHKILGVDAHAYAHIRLKAAENQKSHFEIFLEEHSVEYIQTKPVASTPLHDAATWLAAHVTPTPEDGNCAVFFDHITRPDMAAHTVEGYLHWLALADVQDEINANAKGIKLMTVHGSKGLEFDHVLIAGCNEGVLPSKPAYKSRDAMEDERRVMYVAMTRAKHKLFLAIRPNNDEGGSLPSRFITEAGL